MRFTKEQYEKAIGDLKDAMNQLEPDGRVCVICHDSGHQAWECGSNPLLAMLMYREIAKSAERLHEELHAKVDSQEEATIEWARGVIAQVDKIHEFLHYLAGYDSHMGVQLGPARVKPLS